MWSALFWKGERREGVSRAAGRRYRRGGDAAQSWGKSGTGGLAAFWGRVVEKSYKHTEGLKAGDASQKGGAGGLHFSRPPRCVSPTESRICTQWAWCDHLLNKCVLRALSLGFCCGLCGSPLTQGKNTLETGSLPARAITDSRAREKDRRAWRRQPLSPRRPGLGGNGGGH